MSATAAKKQKPLKRHPSKLKKMSALNLYNTIWAVIFPIVGWPFGVFLMKQFSEGIPTEMLEAARIDGASEARTKGLADAGHRKRTPLFPVQNAYKA